MASEGAGTYGELGGKRVRSLEFCVAHDADQPILSFKQVRKRGYQGVFPFSAADGPPGDLASRLQKKWTRDDVGKQHTSGLVPAQRTGTSDWTGKRGRTFADAMTTVRRWLWADWVLPYTMGRTALEKLPTSARSLILQALAPAA